jgi:signal transduction histidine kinase
MKPPTRWTLNWSFNLTAGILFGAAVLRAFLAYSDDPVLLSVVEILVLLLVLGLLERNIPYQSALPFVLYISFQAFLITILLFLPGYPDYFALLFSILSMLVMQKMPLKPGAVWISLFSVLMFIPLQRMYGVPKTIAFTLVYSAMNAILASYSLALRRVNQAREEAQKLGLELEQANSELQTYAGRVERLAVARERNRLARELHDSVTQTVFSMTLATQSALMLLERDRKQVADQLARLYQLARSAISEMQVLISELNPIDDKEESLDAAIQRHLTNGHMPRGLKVTLEAEGEGALQSKEVKALFRIVQEALNNVIKHAKTDDVSIHLHLTDPFWIEVVDHGRGFDPKHVGHDRGIGLAGMQERAEEIGWELKVTSAPGKGTTVHVAKARGRRQGARWQSQK